MPLYNWYIVVTEENQHVVSEWRFGNLYPNYKLDIGQITGIYKDGSKQHNPRNSTEGFGIEISFDQFKKYVLNESIEETDYSYLIPILKKHNIK